MSLAHLSLGSNVGDREAHLREALSQLASVGRVLALSCFYETEPLEFTAQPWFLNCALTLETQMTPHKLMTSVLQIEKQMGRERVQKKGPRSIDIDILLFDNRIIESERLKVPHAAMHMRRFVLQPLAEIAPDVLHPLLKKTIGELRDSLPQGQVVKKVTSIDADQWKRSWSTARKDK